MTSTLNAVFNDSGITTYGCTPGQLIRLSVETDIEGDWRCDWGDWEARLGPLTHPQPGEPHLHLAVWDTRTCPHGQQTLVVRVIPAGRRAQAEEARLDFYVQDPASLPQATALVEGAQTIAAALTERAEEVVEAVGEIRDTLRDSTTVGLRRSTAALTDDVGLWIRIRRSSRGLAFNEYKRVMDYVLCNIQPDSYEEQEFQDLYSQRTGFGGLRGRRALPFNDTEAYRYLKVATEAFLLTRMQIPLDTSFNTFTDAELDDAARRLSVGRDAIDPAALRRYLVRADGSTALTIPYLALVRKTLSDQGIKKDYFVGVEDGQAIGFPEECYGILEEKLTSPLLLELIWSYWHEEGMLVQTMNAITRRFQNIRGPGDRDPLANFETDPLRPLNNLLWGYIQDEQHRLSLVRRAYEYDHHYGISLYGQAVPTLRPADSRSKFMEAFHNLLYRCTLFFQQDDDTTVISDGFPLLSALQEVHLILSQGAHNQFGDLPSTARQEMLVEQWLLARPEFREFLPTRVMVDYPEVWMHRADAMKNLQGWTDTSVLHFHNLGRYGEEIALSIRYAQWNDPNILPDQARNWARYWRAEIQGYVHAYRSVTGVDLSAEVTDSRSAAERALQPSVHLRRQLEQQRGTLPGAERAATLPPRSAPAGALPSPAPANAPARAPNRRLPAGR